MNAVSMSFQQPVAKYTRDSPANKKSGNDLFSFQKALVAHAEKGNSPLPGQLGNLPVQEALANLSSELQAELASLLVGKSDLLEEEVSDNVATLIEDLMQEQGIYDPSLMIQILFTNLSNERDVSSYFVNYAAHASQVNSDAGDETNINQRFTNLYAQVEAILSNVSGEHELMKVAPKILELLEQWTALEEKYGNLNRFTETGTKENGIWNELVHTFQKRNQFSLSQQYNVDAKVTSKDVAKWLNGLYLQANTENPLAGISHGQAMPMSKLEQYVIHINQGQQTQPVDKQLVDQFQQVMKTSRFLSMNNGVTQLSIALRPENLGEMMVRLTEINGEMTVKILVSSQATRQMLEANIHQLKNMFAPHQVIIEEQDFEVQSIQKEQHQEEQSLKDHEQNHSHQSNKDDKRDNEGDFETQFHDLLMNERV